MLPARLDFYQSLRERMRGWLGGKEGKKHRYAEYLMFAPDLFHLLCKLVVDRDVPLEDKARLAAAIVYFVSPLDIVPEILLGPVAWLDDIALAAYVLNRLLNHVEPRVLLRHWAGDTDLLDLIRRILGIINRAIGERTWKRIVRVVERPGR